MTRGGGSGGKIGQTWTELDFERIGLFGLVCMYIIIHAAWGLLAGGLCGVVVVMAMVMAMSVGGARVMRRDGLLLRLEHALFTLYIR